MEAIKDPGDALLILNRMNVPLKRFAKNKNNSVNLKIERAHYKLNLLTSDDTLIKILKSFWGNITSIHIEFSQDVGQYIYEVNAFKSRGQCSGFQIY
eukprot:UN08305